ncbi:RelA/SpoT AH/RIS domain-containing protein [Shigella flexneri]
MTRTSPAGRQILDDELAHLGISLKEAENHRLPRYSFNELDELLAAIGGGDIRLNQMVNFLQAQFNKPSAAEQDAAALKQLQQKSTHRRVAVKTTVVSWWKG